MRAGHSVHRRGSKAARPLTHHSLSLVRRGISPTSMPWSQVAAKRERDLWRTRALVSENEARPTVCTPTSISAPHSSLKVEQLSQQTSSLQADGEERDSISTQTLTQTLPQTRP